MSYHNNLSKDYYRYYQTTEGSVDEEKSFDDKEFLYKAAIYFAITEETSEQTEPNRNDI
ncbi:19529_t:CDS:2 [Cetraspora pellucida]|uniref:19529_t:CDS:1 n=1 Tax=Cetraspora pellucida TaxID=1433469 RepID=A0A9N9H2V1_9GLOM|nr:19529_t:CDS:2 [Cetraspora pellucida]